MRKLAVQLSAAAIAVTALAAMQAGANASTISLPGPHDVAVRTAADPIVSFTTTMLFYRPVTVSPGALAPGDGYVIAGRVTRYGAPDGLSTAQCTFTDTAGPMLRVWAIDYALNNGLIATSGYINGPGQDAPVTLVVDGGTGAYAGAHGYGTLRPTAAGSRVSLHLSS